MDGSGSVDASGEELHTLCIWALEDHRKVGMINPAVLPVYFRLDSCEPWIAKDGFVFSKVGEEEL